MKVITSIIAFSCCLLLGCWHEDLSGFKYRQTWTVNLDSTYARPGRLASYFNMLVTPAGESFVLLKGAKNDHMQFIIAKIGSEGKVIKEFSRPLEDELLYPYRQSFLSDGKLTVFMQTPGAPFLILQLDTELNVLKEV